MQLSEERHSEVKDMELFILLDHFPGGERHAKAFKSKEGSG